MLEWMVDFSTCLQINVGVTVICSEGIWGIERVLMLLGLLVSVAVAQPSLQSFHALLRRLSAEGSFTLNLESPLSKVSTPMFSLNCDSATPQCSLQLQLANVAPV
jgi:hypothetical protein